VAIGHTYITVCERCNEQIQKHVAYVNWAAGILREEMEAGGWK